MLACSPAAGASSVTSVRTLGPPGRAAFIRWSRLSVSSGILYPLLRMFGEERGAGGAPRCPPQARLDQLSREVNTVFWLSIQLLIRYHLHIDCSTCARVSPRDSAGLPSGTLGRTALGDLSLSGITHVRWVFIEGWSLEGTGLLPVRVAATLGWPRFVRHAVFDAEWCQRRSM